VARTIWWSITAAIVLFCGYFAIPTKPHHFYIITTPADLGVTMEGFLALKPGIKKSEVDRVLTVPPKLVSTIGPQMTYVWEDNGRAITVVFDNDHLAGKIQSGL